MVAGGAGRAADDAEAVRPILADLRDGLVAASAASPSEDKGRVRRDFRAMIGPVTAAGGGMRGDVCFLSVLLVRVWDPYCETWDWQSFHPPIFFAKCSFGCGVSVVLTVR